MKENKIAILTTFYDFDSAYSLCNCVEDQLRMFCDHGYKIKVIVDENFKSPGGYWDNPNLTYGKTPSIQRSNEGELNEHWQEDVDRFYEVLKKELEGYEVVIGHDITLQPAHLIHNIACRRLADERKDIRWLHWSHSATAPQVRCSNEDAQRLIRHRFPNAFMCYPNDWDRKRVALNYGYEIDKVKCVHHPSDFLSLMFGDEIDIDKIPGITPETKDWLEKNVNYSIKLSKDFVKEFDILNADVISVYPCRLDRGKQVQYNIKTMAKIKELGRSVKMIVIDFHSTGGDKVTYRNELKELGKNWGLTDKELIFMSEWREDTNLHVPRQVVMNLKKIADFHMHSSTSETYSLVVQESMIWRNFCVLNHHTPYMRDIYGSKNVLHEPMGAAVNALTGEDGSTNLNISNEALHFENLAKKVLYMIEIANPVLAQWRMIRKTRSIDYIFRNQLEPLLYCPKE
jgi:glycosyltransferase involved in cell wall biosynthesis